jgi:hypothetical protein
MRRFVRGGLLVVALATTVSALMLAGPLHASTPAGRYMVSNGTVYDTKTGLTWQQAGPSSTMVYSAAKTYCSGLSLAGTGWRVPTIKELLTLVDESIASGPLIDTTAFPGAQATWYWSSTAVISTTTTEYLVAFQNGSANGGPLTNAILVRCVR